MFLTKVVPMYEGLLFACGFAVNTTKSASIYSTIFDSVYFLAGSASSFIKQAGARGGRIDL